MELTNYPFSSKTEALKTTWMFVFAIKSKVLIIENK